MKKIALNAILISFALALAIAERFLPLELIVPVPGLKIGLPNVITMFALLFLDIPSVLTIVFLRCLLAAILIGSLTSFVFSITGGLFAFAIMLLLMKKFDKRVSLIGVSIAGAAAHNTGQILAAVFIMKTFSVFSYLPLLLIGSVITGVITGALIEVLKHKLKKLFDGRFLTMDN